MEDKDIDEHYAITAQPSYSKEGLERHLEYRRDYRERYGDCSYIPIPKAEDYKKMAEWKKNVKFFDEMKEQMTKDVLVEEEAKQVAEYERQQEENRRKDALEMQAREEYRMLENERKEAENLARWERRRATMKDDYPYPSCSVLRHEYVRSLRCLAGDPMDHPSDDEEYMCCDITKK